MGRAWLQIGVLGAVALTGCGRTGRADEQASGTQPAPPPASAAQREPSTGSPATETSSSSSSAQDAVRRESATRTGSALDDKPRRFDIRAASKQYDFGIVFELPCSEDSLMTRGCAGPGNLEVFPKGKTEPLQVFKLEEMRVQFDDSDGVLVNSAELYEDQGTVIVGDFNFDGHQDFALLAGHYASYAGPNYHVYLFSRGKQQFTRSAALSQLTEESLGFFGVDEQRQRITTLSKSGCCMHWTDEYEVVNGQPIKVYYRFEDATGEDVKVTEKRLVPRWGATARWQRKVTHEPMYDD